MKPRVLRTTVSAYTRTPGFVRAYPVTVLAFFTLSCLFLEADYYFYDLRSTIELALLGYLDAWKFLIFGVPIYLIVIPYSAMIAKWALSGDTHRCYVSELVTRGVANFVVITVAFWAVTFVFNTVFYYGIDLYLAPATLSQQEWLPAFACYWVTIAFGYWVSANLAVYGIGLLSGQVALSELDFQATRGSVLRIMTTNYIVGMPLRMLLLLALVYDRHIDILRLDHNILLTVAVAALSTYTGIACMIAQTEIYRTLAERSQ